MAIDSNGSEGDAYRYTKKVLNALPNRNEVCEEYTELMEDRNKELPEHSKVSSWTRCAYMELRSYFFKDGVSKIRFAPGIARIAFGELNLGQETENTDALMRLHEILRIISIAHANEYTRHLGKDDHLYTFEELQEIYGTKISGQWSAMKRRLRPVQQSAGSRTIPARDAITPPTKKSRLSDTISFTITRRQRPVRQSVGTRTTPARDATIRRMKKSPLLATTS